MSNVASFKLILLLLIAIIGLELLAKRFRLPPAAALIVGGAALAFVPGLPAVALDPELALVVFLPPLLMNGAYYIAWDDFKHHFRGIMLLAIGAVTFTTLLVGYCTHLLLPGLPWGCCFALGAIVSPPDAIAAKAVLERVKLPGKVMVLLEGESMLNDASGLVLYRFAVAAVLTGAFSAVDAVANFSLLCIGGVVVGLVIGYAAIKLIKALTEPFLVIITSVLPAWICYIAAEELDVSGVMATVTYGMMLGWHQHDVVSATVRTQGVAFWRVLTFMLESLVFVFIGLSLRGVLERIGGMERAFSEFAPAVTLIVGVVLISRFIWIFATDSISALIATFFKKGGFQLDWRAAIIKSWAGMRGVVTLAAALALPTSLPGRDFILVTSFVVILVTVLIQGTSIGWLIALLNMKKDAHGEHAYLTEPQCWALLEAAQFSAVEARAYDGDGKLLHPRLLEQYGYRARISDLHRNAPELPVDARTAHYDIILAAIAAGREALLKLHRSRQLNDEMLHMLERDLDLQEIAAIHSRGD